jgi:putative DNA primase/helicase
MIKLAQSEQGIQVHTDEFDKDPLLLNILNGTIDLKTMKLLPHRRENLITKLVPVELHKSRNLCAKPHCPTWRNFLMRSFQGSRKMIAYLRRVVGYALSGETIEQCLFFLYGLGANGKTTFMETTRGLLGDYAVQADFSTFTKQNRSAVRNDIARLRGARFVSAVEVDSGEHFHEVLLKQLTGEDRVAARFLYQEFFEFAPQSKIFLVANHKPEITGTDHAMWRRVQMIHFNVTIPEEEQDARLKEKLKQELPGILSWALHGYREWAALGLQPPEEVIQATEQYKTEMDRIGGFVGDCCVLSPTQTATAKDLYEAYERWCLENGEEILPKQAFGRRLSDRGLTKCRGRRARFWSGIGLKN